MNLDRRSIERHDFPVKRRGYDPDAVAAHLAGLADQIESLRASESLAATASDQVRLIVEAAERSAAELRREAEVERDRILEDARREAQVHVGEVAASSESMLQRAQVLESELESLLGFVRGSAARLTGELESPAEPVQPPPPPPASRAQPASPPDDEGARLVALNMALNGTPREETERYLADHFGGEDLQGLLDDVYVRAGQ